MGKFFGRKLIYKPEDIVGIEKAGKTEKVEYYMARGYESFEFECGESSEGAEDDGSCGCYGPGCNIETYSGELVRKLFFNKEEAIKFVDNLMASGYRATTRGPITKCMAAEIEIFNSKGEPTDSLYCENKIEVVKKPVWG